MNLSLLNVWIDEHDCLHLSVGITSDVSGPTPLELRYCPVAGVTVVGTRSGEQVERARVAVARHWMTPELRRAFRTFAGLSEQQRDKMFPVFRRMILTLD